MFANHQPPTVLLRYLPLLCLLSLHCTRDPAPSNNTGPTVAKWQKITLDFTGPETSEDADINPFTDYRLDVKFTHEDYTITVPGFYAADGNAANSGAAKGNVWQVRFRPDREGEWTYEGILVEGDGAYQATVLNLETGGDMGPVKELDSYTGTFNVGPPRTDETGRLVRTHPRYLQWAETEKYFLKGGVDSPENLLAYEDFDGTYRHSNEFRKGENKTEGLHHFRAHAGDFVSGNPTWMNGKGKGIIGAINYLASVGVNSIYFLTLNINGDGKDVWPYVDHETFDRFDVSKLDQWEKVFDHADSLGLMLHFVLNETENETLLDGGDTGPQRKIYFRELVARFGHHRAVTWNLGEENGPNNWSETAQDNEQQRAVAAWFAENDPYRNYVVLHTHPGAEAFAAIYEPLLGNSDLGGLSLQIGSPYTANAVTEKWLKLSAEAGAPWIMTLDEVGPWWRGLDPDEEGLLSPETNNQDSLRALTLWGNLMAGGAGVEWYFGAKNPNNDLSMEDWRSRDRAWKWTTAARKFFENNVPFWEMEGRNDLVSPGEQMCFAKEGEVYLVSSPFGRPAQLDLTGQEGDFTMTWFHQIDGAPIDSLTVISGGKVVELTPPGTGDWVALLKK